MRGSYWKTLLVITVSGAAASPSRSGRCGLAVKTSIGTFLGTANDSSGVESWLGVPFAQPPVGELRFRAPVAITTPLKEVQDASRFGSACPQPVSTTDKTTKLCEGKSNLHRFLQSPLGCQSVRIALS